MPIYTGQGSNMFTVEGIRGITNLGDTASETIIGAISQSDGRHQVAEFDFTFHSDSRYSVKHEKWIIVFTKYSTWNGIYGTPVRTFNGAVKSHNPTHNNMADATMTVTANTTVDYDIAVGCEGTGEGSYDVHCSWLVKLYSTYDYPVWTST